MRTSEDNKKFWEEYRKDRNKKWVVIIALIISCITIALIATTIGPFEISVKQSLWVVVNNMFRGISNCARSSIVKVVWLVRVPRILTALLVGFSLAVAGAVMQPVLRNPMASPFTLGISSGASFGAAIAIILGKSIGKGSYAIIVNAFVFSLLSSVIILLVSKRKGTTAEMMILVGVALSYFFSACTSVIQYFAESWQTAEVVFWMVGSLAKGTWDTLAIMFPVALVCIPFLMIKAKELNTISSGDNEAKSMGINVQRTRIILMIVTSLLTATTICFTGAIGFVGLIAPHITRILIGGDNKFVIPIAGLIGALLLLIGDIVAMNVIAPVIIPIGVMTSFIGVPMFIYLIISRRGNNI
ncbi:iron ABC transporter permease [Clostridium sp. 'deep sea']|uniref:FecCD family ABC transporter permease n=1 Tax=Clostridium sp. 'deep sea' TaxID=2779445 RepID=UPI0018968EF1|nr:iron ABC transporter permease [Clostridium sp. 'deep sea']QOR35226.1 iron ABC transporter permease [Clostridium sp. 'deep sea']